MKKYTFLAAMVLASCSPAPSYAVTTEQCAQLSEAYVMAAQAHGLTNDALQNAIAVRFKLISGKGASKIVDDTEASRIKSSSKGVKGRASLKFDECLQNNQKFQKTYFYGEY